MCRMSASDHHGLHEGSVRIAFGDDSRWARPRSKKVKIDVARYLSDAFYCESLRGRRAKYFYQLGRSRRRFNERRFLEATRRALILRARYSPLPRVVGQILNRGV